MTLAIQLLNMVAVAVADLDGFGPFNEAHGAEAGDAVLASFERSLTGRRPAGALVAHVRGDEFAIALARHEL